MDNEQMQRIKIAAEALVRELDASGVELDVSFCRNSITFLGGPEQHKHHISITRTIKEEIYP